MPLLEIVRTDKTSSQVIFDLMDVGKKIKKTPIVVGNCTGFAVNRMFFPYSQSALLLTDLGLDVYRIDKAITSFGMPMGPFRLCDPKSTSMFRDGTSGYIYKHWKGVVYPKGLPQKKWFKHYAQIFDTVEINNTFYRLPSHEVFESWRDQAPEGFCDVLNFSRFGTHLK